MPAGNRRLPSLRRAGREREALEAAGHGTGSRQGARPSQADRLITELARRGVGRVALEPTGRMHLAVWRALAAAGIAVLVLNPQRARRFAEALGRLAKTDRVDAWVLAQAAARLDLAPAAPPSEEHCRLQELQAHRRSLVGRRIALANRAGTATDALVRQQIEAERHLLERHLQEVEQTLETRVAADRALARDLRHPALHPRVSGRSQRWP